MELAESYHSRMTLARLLSLGPLLLAQMDLAERLLLRATLLSRNGKSVLAQYIYSTMQESLRSGPVAGSSILSILPTAKGCTR